MHFHYKCVMSVSQHAPAGASMHHKKNTIEHGFSAPRFAQNSQDSQELSDSRAKARTRQTQKHLP